MFIVLQPVRRGIQLQEEATNHKSEWCYGLHFSYLVSDWFSFAHNRQVRNISSVNGSLSFTVIASKLSIPMGELYPEFNSVSEQTILGKICGRKDLWREVTHITVHWAKFSNKHFQQYHYCHDYERLNIYWAPLWLQIFYIHTVRSSFKFVLCALVNISGIEEIWSRLKKIKE